jgi:UDP-MurNAc hydroxylase
VRALGHAGLEVESARARVLVDPWLSPQGAFQGSWFQFPDNAHLLSPELFRPDAIVISHEHLDHLDPWFLSRVPADVPVVVPRYPSPALATKILRAGPRPIVEAEPWRPVELPGGLSVLFVSEPPMNHDSAIVLQGDGQTLLDLNDARLFPVQLREIRRRVGGRVDLLTFQGAGASWYPMCYRHPPERAARLSLQKRMAKLAYCASLLRVVEPAVAVPFAGPPAFLDPELFRHNDEMEHGIFPDQEQVADWLRGRGFERVLVLLPGDACDLAGGGREADPRWAGFSFADRRAYLDRYASARSAELSAVLAAHPAPERSLWEPFRSYFERLLGLSPYFNARIGMRVGFEVEGPGGGRWSVDFRPGRERVDDELSACGYRYRFHSRWLAPILDGSVPWEDFFLSLRFEATRDPDVYNDHLLGLLKFAHAPALEAVERFETTLGSGERITVRSDGKEYSVQRHCPHAGNDLLQTGEVLPGGLLVCLAHHYTFELATGRCLNGNCSLSVKDLGPTGEERSLHPKA